MGDVSQFFIFPVLGLLGVALKASRPMGSLVHINCYNNSIIDYCLSFILNEIHGISITPPCHQLETRILSRTSYSTNDLVLSH